MNHPYPKFTVLDVQNVGGTLCLVGTIDTTKVGEGSWVGDTYAGYLIREKPLLSGRWHFKDPSWEFTVTEVLDDSVSSYRGQVLDILDCYWGERAELVFDEKLEWSEQQYNEADNHTHCDICWAAISLEENSRYMSNNVNDELCLECYNSYVIPRSLDFIITNQEPEKLSILRRLVAALRRIFTFKQG